MTAPDPHVDPGYFRTAPGLLRRPVGREVKSFTSSCTGRRFRLSVTTQGSAALAGLSEAQRHIEVTVTTEISVLN
jgi:hypothetical protein